MTKTHRVARKLIFCIELIDGNKVPYKRLTMQMPVVML
jgi:hypothetical protein